MSSISRRYQGQSGDLHLTLNPNVLQGVSLTVPVTHTHTVSQMWLVLCVFDAQTGLRPVVEEQLLSRLNGSLGKDSYPVISVHHHHCRAEVVKQLQRW